MQVLTVLSRFGDHDVGDRITDADAVKAILGSEQAHLVVRSDVPDMSPEPEQEKPGFVASVVQAVTGKSSDSASA